MPDRRQRGGGEQLGRPCSETDGGSADLTAGALVAVVGPSGAGKTTLVRTLLGEVAPLAGGVDPQPAAVRVRARHGVAYVPQHVGLVRMLTAWENVGVTASLGHGRAADARRAAQDALTAVGLGQALDQLPDELSGGARCCWPTSRRPNWTRTIAPG